MAASLAFDGDDFAKFAKEVRAIAPQLEKQATAGIRRVGRLAAARMGNDAPHQQTGVAKHVRFSTTVSNRGGAIVVDGLAETFGVGQPGRLGAYKHKVYGKWSSSPKTIMQASDYIELNWAADQPLMEEAVDEAVQTVLEALAGP